MGEPLRSMTAYARNGGVTHGVSFSCEFKSVNGRGLDIRMRLAPGLDALDGELRRRVGALLSRGSVTITINLERMQGEGDIVINDRALGIVIAAIARLEGQLEAQPPTLDGILALKGVIDQREHALSEDEEQQLHAAILEACDGALADLAAVREREGAQLRDILAGHLDSIAALTAAAESHPSRSREAIMARLNEQVAELMATGVGLSPERLAQEALVLATKADIREEIDRLKAHIENARQLLAAGGPVGRKLDFLAQEFNRETNTLCAKSNAVELTAIGLDLKAVIDQLREQIQNVE